MAIKNQYQDQLRAKVVSAVAQARAAASLTHQGVKGAVLEILVGQLFKPLLPSDIGVGTGQIIECYSGRLSNQVDIVLYDKSILPPLLVDEKVGVFPIEAVLYAIEVKTSLDAGELKKAHQHAENLQTKFGYVPGKRNERGEVTHHNIEKVRSVVFALNSNLSDKGISEAERYKKIYKDGPAYIRSICVVGKVYSYDDGDFWRSHQSSDPYDEVLGFMGGIMNTYRLVSESRGYPALGHYIVPDAQALTSIKSRDVPSIQIMCNGCGRQSDFVPNLGGGRLTVKGQIVSATKCSVCNGTMSSVDGMYEFGDGKLVSFVPN